MSKQSRIEELEVRVEILEKAVGVLRTIGAAANNGKIGLQQEVGAPQPLGRDRNGTRVYEGDCVMGRPDALHPLRLVIGKTPVGGTAIFYPEGTYRGPLEETPDYVLWECGPNNPNCRKAVE